MSVNRFSDASYALVVGAIVNNNASKILITLIPDRPDSVSHEMCVVTIDNYDVYRRLLYEIVQGGCGQSFAHFAHATSISRLPEALGYIPEQCMIVASTACAQVHPLLCCTPAAWS